MAERAVPTRPGFSEMAYDMGTARETLVFQVAPCQVPLPTPTTACLHFMP